jgi:hypothetical protein
MLTDKAILYWFPMRLTNVVWDTSPRHAIFPDDAHLAHQLACTELYYSIEMTQVDLTKMKIKDINPIVVQ